MSVGLFILSYQLGVNSFVLLFAELSQPPLNAPFDSNVVLISAAVVCVSRNRASGHVAFY